MKKNIIITAVMLFFGATSLIAQDNHSILRNIDENTTFPDTDLSMTMAMVQEDPEKGTEKTLIQSFRNDEEDSFLILIKEPEVQLGQGYLNVDDNLWFYDPESRKFTHTSMKESFQGSDARNSDFEASSYEKDYRITSSEKGKLGSYNVLILELEALHDEVTYPFLKLWVMEESYLVLKSEEYSLTERLLRTSYFPSYARVGERYLADQMIFVDAVVDGKKTSISLSNISTAELPSYVFTKAYVERVNR